ncbi:MAG: DUF3299 domain-containing protein [Bacteroidota bacterium]
MRYFLLFCLIILSACQAGTSEPQIEVEPELNSDTTTTVEEDNLFAPFDSANYEFEKNAVAIDWDLLAHIDYIERYTEEVEAYVAYPIFDPIVKALNGKTVRIKGFLIPIDETGDENILVLSANPYSSCFFCGGAGPESVMDILLKDKSKRFNTDEVVTFEGKLKLNDSDLYFLNYIMEDAKVVR